MLFIFILTRNSQKIWGKKAKKLEINILVCVFDAAIKNKLYKPTKEAA